MCKIWIFLFRWGFMLLLHCSIYHNSSLKQQVQMKSLLMIQGFITREIVSQVDSIKQQFPGSLFECPINNHVSSIVNSPSLGCNIIEIYLQIAVKRLKVWSNKAEMEFAVEVEVLARVRHKNLLSLRGYCAEGQERLIVYDYMPNLSLLSHLHGQHSTESLLDWNRRMKIAIGSAGGIV